MVERSLLRSLLSLFFLGAAAAPSSHAFSSGPYGSSCGLLTAHAISAGLVVTGLPASESATVASLTAGGPASVRKVPRKRSEPQGAPPAPRFDPPGSNLPVVPPAHRAPRRHLFERAGETWAAALAHPPSDDDDEDDDEKHVDRFSMRGEALWLRRDRAPNILLAQTVTAAGTPDGRGTLLLDPVQAFDVETGFRTSVIYRFNPDTAVEIGYFGSQEWAESAQLTGGPPAFFVQSPLLGTTIATAGETFDTSVQADYNAQVHNGEANVVRAFSMGGSDHSRWLFGLRVFTWRDDLELIGVQTAAGLTERARAVADNTLVGPHAGVDLAHPLGHGVDLGMVSKAGLFVNFAETKLENRSFPASGAPPTTNFLLPADETALGTVVDTAFQLTWAPFRWFKIRGGYQLLYARGLALAPSIFANTGTSLRDLPQVAAPADLGRRVDHGGDVFLNGAFAGGEVRF